MESGATGFARAGVGTTGGLVRTGALVVEDGGDIPFMPGIAGMDRTDVVGRVPVAGLAAGVCTAGACTCGVTAGTA